MSSLCGRCGAVVPPSNPGADGTLSGECPACGLGFTGLMLTFTEARNPVTRWRQRRRALRMTAEHRQRRIAMFSSPPFPIYGLDASWRGRRWAGGWGTSGSSGTADRLELGHGEPHDDAAPLIRITTRGLGRSRLDWALTAQELAAGLWRDGMDHTAAIRAPFTNDDPTAGWDEVPLSVEGTEVVFHLLGSEASWVALGRIIDSIVSIDASRVEPGTVRLSVIDDLSPYLADDGMLRH